MAWTWWDWSISWHWRRWRSM